jgi:hypothetical protein
MSAHSSDYKYLVPPGNRVSSVRGEWFSRLKFCRDLYNPSADTGIVATWLKCRFLFVSHNFSALLYPLGNVRAIYRTAKNFLNLHFLFFQKINVLNFFKKCCTLSISFSSKCRLFHNFTFFLALYFCILYTGCAK